MKIEVYWDKGINWRWRILARNGKTVAASGEAFDSKGNAQRAAKAFVRNLFKSVANDSLRFVVIEA